MTIIAWFLAIVTAAGVEPPPDPHASVRGVTVSVPTWGWEWGSDSMAETLDVLKQMGVNWVAIHPYAQIRNDGGVSHQIDPSSPPVWITRPIAEAHARGIKVMVKPHLAYWGGQFAWRGEIQFTDDAHWRRFFQDYEAWIAALVAVAHDADAFAVGTELDKTAHRPEWSSVIATARGFSGPLTYAANWDQYHQVPFWEDLDVIGIQAYFPLAEDPGVVPSSAELEDRWGEVMGDIRRVHTATGKPVVFTELGYSRSTRALHEPWSAEVGGAGAEELQKVGLHAALTAIDREPMVTGAFLWKWFPGEPQIGNFRMSSPEMKAVIQQEWGATHTPP